jgi:hypothetical protein
MAKLGRAMAEHDWLVVYTLATGYGERPYVELSTFSEGDEPSGFPSNDNPERTFLKKETTRNLSKEAKDIIRLIFTSPSEVIEELVTPVHECYSKRKICKMLQKKGWERKKVLKAFAEIRIYVSEIDSIG